MKHEHGSLLYELLPIFCITQKRNSNFSGNNGVGLPFLASESKSGVILVVAILRIDLRCWSVNLDL